jgi:HSP20 family molecular chaperone IbpA
MRAIHESATKSKKQNGGEIMTTELAKKEQGNVATVERTRDSLTYIPQADIWETDDELRVYADLPGVSPENLDVRFENGELTIYGKVNPRHDDITFLFGEYGIGDFHRTFTVGEMIDASKISAELRDGVLTLHLPKMEEVKPRRIQVKAK